MKVILSGRREVSVGAHTVTRPSTPYRWLEHHSSLNKENPMAIVTVLIVGRKKKVSQSSSNYYRIVDFLLWGALSNQES